MARGWTDDEAASAGRSDGFEWAYRKAKEDPAVLVRYASGPAERRLLERNLSTLMHIAARSRVERFGARDSKRRDEKVRLYVDAYVAAAMSELGRLSARQAAG